MPSITAVRNALPAFKNQKQIIQQHQGTRDIIREILRTHELYVRDYDRIYTLFDTGDIYKTCSLIWDFLKYNLTYSEEEDEQSVRSPSAIVAPGQHIDCKHYSLFAGGVLDAICRAYNESWTWCYRFVTDKRGEDEPTHVFVVVFDQGREIWIDPCMYSFNYHRNWLLSIDKQPMSLVRISGIGAQETPVSVNKDAAWVSFLQAVLFDLFSLKDLIQQNPDVTQTALKDYCQQNGFDYNQLMTFVQAQI